MEKEIKIKPKQKLITYTDKNGFIFDGNQEFSFISGYKKDEYLGKPHNIIRHRDMPKTIFKKLWEYIQRGENFVGVIKNRAKNGDYYWVMTDFTVLYDGKGEILGYKAVRRPVTTAAKDEMSALYELLVDIEEKDGIEAASGYLDNFLAAKGITIKEYTEQLLERKTLKEKLS